MKLSEYPDDDLLEEVKRRGFEIKLVRELTTMTLSNGNKLRSIDPFVIIGGVRFELTT